MSAHAVRGPTTSFEFCGENTKRYEDLDAPPVCASVDENLNRVPYTETPVQTREFQTGPNGLVQGVDPWGNPFQHYAE
jgi:hypothetical protein